MLSTPRRHENEKYISYNIPSIYYVLLKQCGIKMWKRPEQNRAYMHCYIKFAVLLKGYFLMPNICRNKLNYVF